MTPKEVAFDVADIQRLIQVVPPEAVLVGGQALAYWAQYGLDLFAPMDIIASLDFTTPHGLQFKEMRYPRLLDEMGKKRKPGPSLGHRR